MHADSKLSLTVAGTITTSRSAEPSVDPSPSTPDRSGNDYLTNTVEIIKLLCMTYPQSVTMRDKHGETPYDLALRQRCLRRQRQDIGLRHGGTRRDCNDCSSDRSIITLLGHLTDRAVNDVNPAHVQRTIYPDDSSTNVDDWIYNNHEEGVIMRAPSSGSSEVLFPLSFVDDESYYVTPTVSTITNDSDDEKSDDRKESSDMYRHQRHNEYHYHPNDTDLQQIRAHLTPKHLGMVLWDFIF